MSIIEVWPNKLAEGIKKLTDVVATTMWPKGKNIVLDKGVKSPIVTNDWVTVVNEIQLEDEAENTGAFMLKEACKLTNFHAWDWTTTTAVLTNAIIQEWLKNIDKWINPFILAEDMKTIGNKIIEDIKLNSVEVDSKSKVYEVAKISSQSEEVAKEIADMYENLDSDMVVTIENMSSLWIESEIKKWCQFNTWYASPYFITNMERKEAELKDTAVFITDKDLKTPNDITPVLNKAVKAGKTNLLIVATTIVGEALAMLIINKMKGVINTVAVKAPWYWDNKIEFLEDVAILTWGKFIRKDEWFDIASFKEEMLWFAGKVIARENETVIVEWGWSQEDVDSRIVYLKKQIKDTGSEFEKKNFQERLSKMLGRVGVIRVWEATEMETLNKKFKVEDAVNAVRSALEEWISIWGWCAYIQASKKITEKWVAESILNNALEKPFRQIIKNAWLNNDYLTEIQKKNWDYVFGINVNTGEIDDLLKKWIVDSVKVLRVSLENAISTAIMVLNSSYLIYNKKDNAEIRGDSV